MPFWWIATGLLAFASLAQALATLGCALSLFRGAPPPVASLDGPE